MRNVIVTGGSRGLGLAIARQLAAAHYRVIAIARKASEELAAFPDDEPLVAHTPTSQSTAPAPLS